MAWRHCPRYSFAEVHLSADCVFDGTKPPYSVESRPNPLSEYGFFAAKVALFLWIIPRSLLGFTLDLLAISSSPIHGVSAQGWQKLHSEQLVRAACPTAAVLRVPLLYGPVESPLDSAPLLEYAMAIYDEL